MNGNYFSKCYLFSNENLKEYFQYFYVKEKDILTVCGSGDQILSYILYGAKNIDSFDCNKLAYFHYMLKKAAVQSLDFDEFLKLYDIGNHNINKAMIYKKIQCNLQNNDIKHFWNDIFQKNIFNNLFLNKNFHLDLFSKTIPYLNKNDYYKLKENIEKSNVIFDCIDLMEIMNYNKKYDFINLSNIYDYVNKADFIKLINKIIEYNLKTDGCILIDYCWIIQSNTSVNKKTFDSLNAISIKILNNEIKKNDSGEIYIYQKKSK